MVDRVPVPLDASRVRVDLKLDQRRKGLLWYDTYGVAFVGHATGLHNPDAQERTLVVHFAFPSTEALYDGFTLKVDGRELRRGERPLDRASTCTHAARRRAPGEPRSRWATARAGWAPGPTPSRPRASAQVRDFDAGHDHRLRRASTSPPAPSLPRRRRARAAAGGWAGASTAWSRARSSAWTRRDRINPGPLAARITFFAPVSLLFFFTVMVDAGRAARQSLHPVNYFFLAAAFFAFHLLLAYLVDHVNVHVAFALAAATSVFLVVSYLRLVGGLAPRRPARGRGPGRVPRPLQLRVLLRGLHRPHRHRGRGDHAVRPHAGDGAAWTGTTTCSSGRRSGRGCPPAWASARKAGAGRARRAAAAAAASSGAASARNMSSMPIPRTRSFDRGGAAVSARPRAIQHVADPGVHRFERHEQEEGEADLDGQPARVAEAPVTMMKESEPGGDGEHERDVLHDEEGMQAAARAQRLRLAARGGPGAGPPARPGRRRATRRGRRGGRPGGAVQEACGPYVRSSTRRT